MIFKRIIIEEHTLDDIDQTTIFREIKDTEEYDFQVD